MRFKVQPKPKKGDIRYIEVFALLPKRIADEVVWLESYYAKQEFQVYWTMDGIARYWSSEEFYTKEQYNDLYQD